MKKWSQKKKVFFSFLLIFLFIQAFQPKRNAGTASGAKDITKVMLLPDTVLFVLKRSCFDCHSGQTVYPWYARISPVNWWLAYHIEEGKRDVNFSTFGQYSARRQAETLEALAETVKSGDMPLPSYLWMHKEARLTVPQKQVLVAWAAKAKKELTR